jgi:hypothetical protein
MRIHPSQTPHKAVETTPQKKPDLRRLFWVMAVGLLGTMPLLGILLVESQANKSIDIAQHSTNFWRYLISRPAVADLPELQIDAKYKHLYKLQQQREQALEQGQVTEQDFLPAQLQYQGEAMSIDLRLKPGTVESLKTDQWAYQIEIENDDRPFGMKKFSLYKPNPMAFLAEQAWLEHLREEGLIAPRARFVKLLFNGSRQPGLVVQDELSKELLKASDRPEGLFIGYRQLASGRYSLEAMEGGHIDKYFGLQRQRASAIALLQGFLEGTYTAEQVFDVPATAKFLAIASLWPQSSVLAHPQAYFYYNPITAKLEPVGFHIQPQTSSKAQPNASSPNASSPNVSSPNASLAATLPVPPANGWAVQLLQDPAIAAAYQRDHQRLSQPNYWAKIQPQLTAKLRNQEAPLRRPFQTDLVTAVLQQARDLRLAQKDALWASAYNAIPVAFTRIESRAPSQQNSQEPSVPVPQEPLFAPTIPELLAQHSFLRWNEAQRALTILPGEWAVKGDLIIPVGVAIEATAGTRLKFEPKAIFLVKGPLRFWGTAEAPIELSAQQQSWGGLEVWQAQKPSLLKQVSIRQTLGGSLFHNSPVSFIGSRISGSEAREGLKLFNSPFVISNSQFENCADDAIDTEASPGYIDSSQFNNIGGDGIDISHSQVTVQNVDLAQVADKGISVGQNSQLTANNVVIREGAIAISSLDGSTATLNNIKIADMTKAGLTAFTDRLGFSPASINANNVEIHNTPHATLTQSRSQITLNGKALKGDPQTTHLINTQLLNTQEPQN